MHPLRRRIADVLALSPDAAAIEYEGHWSTWQQITELANRIASVGDTDVGILLRNSPTHVAAFLGVLLGGGTVVTINPSRGDDRTRADIAELRLPVIVGESEDLTALVTDAPGTSTVSLSGILDRTDEPAAVSPGAAGV